MVIEPTGRNAGALGEEIEEVMERWAEAEPRASADPHEEALAQQGTPSPWAAEDALKLPREERKLIQHALVAAGSEIGKIDGIFGARTRDAIAAWERTQGRTPDGHLDAEEAHQLMVAGRDSAHSLDPPKIKKQ